MVANPAINKTQPIIFFMHTNSARSAFSPRLRRGEAGGLAEHECAHTDKLLVSPARQSFSSKNLGGWMCHSYIGVAFGYIINQIAAPIKHKIPKIRANLEKFIFWDNFIKKCKVANPTKKLKIKAGHPSKIKTGFLNPK